MNNEKGKTKTATNKAGTKKQADKPAAKETTGAGRGSKPKGSATTKEVATKDNVTAFPSAYRVDQNGGSVVKVKRAEAIKDAMVTDSFTEAGLNEMFDRGEVIFSETYFYANNREALSKWDKNASKAGDAKPKKADKPEAEAATEPVEIKSGDTVYNPTKKVVGKVVGSGKDLFVNYTASGKDKSVKLSDKWIKGDASDLALAISIPAVDGEVIPADDTPLSKDEKKELKEREARIEAAKEQFESAPFVMGNELNEIRVRKLYRETHKRFGDYVMERFGINRSYAQNLAQLSGYNQIAQDALPESTELQLSVNMANQMVRSTNKLIHDLGLDKIPAFEELRPVITNTVRLLADVAPKTESGDLDLSPRFIQTFNDTLRSVITSKVVHLDGQAMTVEEAQKQGILSNLFQAEVVEATAESIKANYETIRTETQAAWERLNEPQQADTASRRKVFYSGTIPELSVSCDKHGATKIISIGTGKFQTKCKCRWHVSTDGQLVCFEVNGKPVKRTA